ncbi:hypothetical protein C8A05DRAFT_38553 [Staphylotrichum tortipilum]|uniref:Uncharacterized protein n=1 Tax=Staphylotrichum tortipilum TaxID=2831512 RepID=A0AAN6MCZ1_9PEZI|nr:hypothetical protein C8A05DRAFT_38553 [Staphylotrichum longicolle]
MADPAQGRNRSKSNASSVLQRLSRDFEDSHPPEGLMAVASDVASTMLSGHPHPDEQTVVAQTTTPTEKRAASIETPQPPSDDGGATRVSSTDKTTTAVPDAVTPMIGSASTEPFPNGYHFPPKYPFRDATAQGLKDFWRFFTTPWGFFWTVYGLNIVAWGGMLFLLLCNAAPAMCYPTCNDIDSPRRKWIEWDSQILTALFCVTAFGLAPWRFRDLYLLMMYRLWRDQDGLRRLAGVHNGWFHLPGTQDLDVTVGPENIPGDVPQSCVPIPEKSMPPPPLTGVRAPATAVWKLDFVIWCMVLNTFAQCGLCGIMWGMNRFDRPSWTTGFLVAVACVIAMVGGLAMFLEGKKVKGVEGVPLTERDREKLASDRELGIPHYNNLKDAKPKEGKGKGGVEAEK